MKRTRNMFNFITIQLAINNIDPFNNKLDSLYFKAALRLSNLRFVARIANEAKKDESLGHLWNDVKPSQDGYIFEFASELPYYLPSLDNQAEYELYVGDRQYIVCNRMVRAYFIDPTGADGEPEYYLVHQLGVTSLKKQMSLKNVSLCPVPMKCFISSKYRCSEQNAEDAIIKYFLSWQAEHLRGISHILRAIRATIPLESSYIMPVSSALIPITWVAIKGENNKIGCQQFASNLGMVIHLPTVKLDHVKSLNIRSLLLLEQSPIFLRILWGLQKRSFIMGILI